MTANNLFTNVCENWKDLKIVYHDLCENHEFVTSWADFSSRQSNPLPMPQDLHRRYQSENLCHITDKGELSIILLNLVVEKKGILFANHRLSPLDSMEIMYILHGSREKNTPDSNEFKLYIPCPAHERHELSSFVSSGLNDFYYPQIKCIPAEYFQFTTLPEEIFTKLEYQESVGGSYKLLTLASLKSM